MDEKERFPVAAEIVENDFYVDDVLSGANSIPEAVASIDQLKRLLESGGFPIHKWSSNSPEILMTVPEEEKEKPSELENISGSEVIKTLGMLWDPVKDEFLFAVPEAEKVEVRNITKRYVLSQIARLYDPLGLVSPVVVLAKLIMQDLWVSEIGWDEQLKEEQLKAWQTFTHSLPDISTMRIPRGVCSPNADVIELHGFADASKVAYGACLYVRCIGRDGVTSKLLCSKSKIAPLKQMTIPRQELCAALLLSRLVEKAVPALQMEFQRILLWIVKSYLPGFRNLRPLCRSSYETECRKSTNRPTNGMRHGITCTHRKTQQILCLVDNSRIRYESTICGGAVRSS